MTARGQFRILKSALAGVEVIAADSAHTFARHTHETFGIGLVERGAQKSASGRGMVEAGAGDVITVNPGEVHDGAPIGEAGRAWRMLYIDPAVIAETAADIAAAPAAFEFHDPVLADRRIAARINRLLAAAADPAGESLLVMLVADVLRRQNGPGLGTRSVASIAAARARIDDDPADPVSLAELARLAGLTRFQLLRAFARETGLTPHAYQVQRRIDLARRLMAGNVPLAQAALAAGFADQAHMTRIFTRKYGLTPAAYRAARLQ
ncbi:AraC family transcriptional regulator [Devosia geojensis]|uniref:AraC family transcriptional regulator n=1 Tax=Devosia geojensis TaxID=443610 RepID=A0A0F5FJK1_9HYPH|nr:AraC family transcriptional regulator [Devosia geojensis]KKB08402.1 AraC family transcriptional regulator [Devosia geojensis]